MKEIGTRLREFRIRSDISMPAIASATGISKETLYKWEKGTRPSNIDDYYKLKIYLDKAESKLEEEAFELEAQKQSTLKLPLSNTRPAVPQTDGKATSGTVILTNDGPELIVERINAPFLGHVDGVIEVTGESMAPTFSNGCRVGILRLNDIRILNWGLCYFIIDNNWQGIVRRLYQGETTDSLLLVSDHPNQKLFPPIIRQWEQIKAVFNIVASFIKQ